MMEHTGNDPEHENEIWWCMNHAAAQIQKVYRGYRTRGKFAMSFADIVKLLSFEPKEAEIPKSSALSSVATSTVVEAKNPSPNSILNMDERLSGLESMQRKIIKNVTEIEERSKEHFQLLLRSTQEGESQSTKNAVEDHMAETLALPWADLKSNLQQYLETTQTLFKFMRQNGDGSYTRNLSSTEPESQSSPPGAARHGMKEHVRRPYRKGTTNPLQTKRYTISQYNRPRAGQPNRRYDKKKHKQQIEELHFLRQKEECTFVPALCKRKGVRAIRKHPDSGNVFDRLQSEGQKREERRKKRVARQSCSKFTFSPNILATSKSTPAVSSAATFQRLYADGQKHREKREKIYLNRPKPAFEPDLSPSRDYYEKHWYCREKRKKKFRTRKAVERGTKALLPPLQPSRRTE